LLDLLTRQLEAASGRGQAESRLLVLHHVFSLEEISHLPAVNP
jgi:hypothetical protein